MTTITYRYQSYEVDPCTLLVRGDSFYARLSISGRVPMTVYVKVAPPAETLVYGCELPPRAIVVWTPVITLTPSMAAQVNHALGVEILVAA